jgi:hypothetical protein
MDGKGESELTKDISVVVLSDGSIRQSMGDQVGLFDGLAVALSVGEKDGFKVLPLMLGGKVAMSVSKVGS